jgi:hypothetical protein
VRKPNHTAISKGQGVIEYAAALVVATTLVSMVLTILPGDFMNYFNTLLETFSAMVVQFLP